MLAANVASLQAQTCPDWKQTLLVDDAGRGIGWASENMARYAPRLVGDYIWILDDDDLCLFAGFVEGLRTIAEQRTPDIVMVKMDHGEVGILPPAMLWGQRPVMGAIGVSAYVARRELWQKCARALIPGKYTSDFELINAMWRRARTIYWWNVVASQVQMIGHGRPE
jgi:hypothetical protein